MRNNSIQTLHDIKHYKHLYKCPQKEKINKQTVVAKMQTISLHALCDIKREEGMM